MWHATFVIAQLLHVLQITALTCNMCVLTTICKYYIQQVDVWQVVCVATPKLEQSCDFIFNC